LAINLSAPPPQKISFLLIQVSISIRLSISEQKKAFSSRAALHWVQLFWNYLRSAANNCHFACMQNKHTVGKHSFVCNVTKIKIECHCSIKSLRMFSLKQRFWGQLLELHQEIAFATNFPAINCRCSN
jgi:hypothetical protein